MKKLLFILLPLACMLAGCKYDDSKLWEELNAQKAQIASLESLNSNVNSLQSLVSALQKNITVTAVRATEKGHTVSFSDGTTVTILNADAMVPMIGAKQDSDGNYYWTVAGNWLLDASGEKVPTGKTPKLKIEDDQWMVSYDDGASWNKIEGQASSVSLFESVSTDADKAVFTLTDGTVITLPLANAANKLQLVFNEGIFEKMRNNEVLSTPYKIIAPEGAKTDLQTFESDGWTVTIYPNDEKSGRISIKSPAKVSPTKVLFMLTDDQGGSFTKIIKIGFNEEAKPQVQTEYFVDPTGGDIIIPVNSCVATLSDDAEGWAEVVEVGEQVIVSVQPNESYDYRLCKVTLEDGTVINITQITEDALILSSDKVEIDGRRQKVNFVVSTNVTVKATVTEGSDWLSVSPTTRSLTDKVFTFNATRNTTGEERTATVVFTGNDLTQTCTVIQAPYTGGPGIDVTEAAATEEGEDIELETSLVTALTTDGFVVSDGESAIYVYAGQSSVEIGDSVSFKALTGTFNGLSSLENVSDLNVASSGNRVNYPSASNITSALDSYEASTPQFVTVTGDLTVENGVYNLAVPGATTKVILYNPSYVVGLEALDGHNVTVNGYWYGASDGTAYIIATKKSDNGSSSMTITQVIGLPDGTEVDVKEALVVAKTTKGLIVSDGTSYCYLYLNADQGAVGDIVSITGSKTTYREVPEIEKASMKVLSSNNEVSHPTPTDITSSIDNYSASVAEYITLTGDLVVSGSYYNIIVEGNSRRGSIVYPATPISNLNGRNVTVKGYYNGQNASGGVTYVNIVITDITDNGPGQNGGDITPGGDDNPGGGGDSQVDGDTETVDFSAQGYGNAESVSSFSGQYFSISFDKGTNRNDPKYYNTGNAIRCYGSNYFTVSSDKTIVGITITFGSGDGSNDISVDTGSYSDGSWSGSANSVTFSIGGTSGHRRIAGIAVTFEE